MRGWTKADNGTDWYRVSPAGNKVYIRFVDGVYLATFSAGRRRKPILTMSDLNLGVVTTWIEKAVHGFFGSWDAEWTTKGLQVYPCLVRNHDFG